MSFGGAPIGNFLRPFGDADACGMVDQAWDSGIRYFDTAPGYGHGLSEHRLGHALQGVPREDFVLSTKVGRILKPASLGSFDSGPWVDPPPFESIYDYTYDGVMRSIEDSLQRLLTDRVEIVMMHDIDRYTHGDDQRSMFDEAISGGFKALEQLRDEGTVRAIGVGVNEVDVCLETVRRVDLDCVLLAGRYTLLEQEPLDDLLPECGDREIGVVLGGVFNSGVLATGPVRGAKFNYGPAPQEVLDRSAAIQTVCERHGVPLPAAALHFAAAHPVVSSICLGSRNQAQQAKSVEWLGSHIPAELWTDLRRAGLIREDAPTPE